MGNAWRRWMGAVLVGAGLCCAGLSAQAENGNEGGTKKEAAARKNQMTVTGTAKAVPNKTDATQKHLEVTAVGGIPYLLIGKPVSGEAVAQFDGKTVKVTGIMKKADDMRRLYVSAIEEVK